MSAMLRVRDLVKHFPVRQGLFGRSTSTVRAVDGVSFELAAGKTFAIVGESGCGKSTVARLLLRLIEPTSGQLELDGHDLIAADATAMREALLRGQVRDVADILMRSWASKKRTAKGIATEAVDRLFDHGMANGAWGGKVSGAGGGGFLMFCTDPENRYRLVSALNEAGGQATSVSFTFEGAEAWSVPR